MHGKHAVPAVSVTAGLTASVGLVPLALSGAAAPAPVAHGEGTATLDTEIVRQLPAPRPLVTRIIRASARKSYTIVSGDTLSGISGKFCHAAKKWPGVWSQNKAKIKNPDMIVPGQKLTFTCEGVTAALAAAAMNAIPKPVIVAAEVSPVTAAPVQQAPVQAALVSTAPAHHDQFDGHHGLCGDGDGDGMDAPCSAIFPSAPAQQSAPAPRRATAVVTGASGMVSTAGLGSMQACIISRESGGNPQITNASGHWGLYQFSYSTWVAHGGSPADFGHAGAAVQNDVYAATVAADGYSDWAPYDGC